MRANTKPHKLVTHAQAKLAMTAASNPQATGLVQRYKRIKRLANNTPNRLNPISAAMGSAIKTCNESFAVSGSINERAYKGKNPKGSAQANVNPNTIGRANRGDAEPL